MRTRCTHFFKGTPSDHINAEDCTQRTVDFQRRQREREGQELLGYLGKMVTEVCLT